MKQLAGFFEFELESDGLAFLVTVEIVAPGLEESVAKTKVIEEWSIHFAITAPVQLGTLDCVKVRPLAGKPEDALKVPRGTGSVLIWKSVEE